MSDKSAESDSKSTNSLDELVNILASRSVMSRRTFNKSVLCAGFGLGLGGTFLTSCGLMDSADLPVDIPLRTEARTLHFDLSQYPLEHEHSLHVAGKAYSLTAHTVLTLALAKESNASLARFPDNQVTHYVDNVMLNADRPQRFHVTSMGPRGYSLAGVALHIPTTSRQAIRSSLTIKESLQRSFSVQACSEVDQGCSLDDYVADDFHTSVDTAKAILFHHPEIMNMNPDSAALIEKIMDSSAALANLANEICNQGPAYEHDPDYYDGWAILVPMLNDDGTPRIKSTGEQMYDYVFSDRTNAALKLAVQEILALVKDSTDLADSSYRVQYNNPVVGAGPPQTAAFRSAVRATGGVQWTSSNPGWTGFLYFGETDPVDGDPRSFTININNMNLLWYGIYVQYLDADNNGIVVTESDLVSSTSSVLDSLKDDYNSIQTATAGTINPVVPPVIPLALNAGDWVASLETDTIRFKDICASPATILGLPIPSLPTKLEFTLPDGAVKARIMFCGPGAGGHVDHVETVLIGAIMTLIVQYAIPTYFLIKGSGEDEDASLKVVLKNKGVWLKILMVAKSLLSEILHADTANTLALGSSIEGLAAKSVDIVLKIMSQGLVKPLEKWLITKWVEEELEDSIPFAGWALRLLTDVGSVLDLAVTTAEILANPLVIENTVSASQDVTVTVFPDPAHALFPLTATKLEASVTIGARTFTNFCALSSIDLVKTQLTVTINGIPATGKNENIEVRLLSASGWLAAHSANQQSDNSWVPGAVIFSNKVPSGSGAAIASVTLLENPVPITATTLYSHHQKLGYAGGVYQWQYTATKPALDPLNCSAAGGLCELGNISLWVPGGMIGYSWRASSPGAAQCGGSDTGQLYTFQNVSFRADPNIGLKAPGCGFQDPSPVAYDTRSGPESRHFYLDPVNISAADPEYHLRRIVLDNITPLNMSQNESWGRFRIPLDRLAVHPGGFVVGISTAHAKMGVLRIPDNPYPSDALAMNSAVVLGEGLYSDRLVYRPMALTINRHGVILILEGGDNKRIKAFNADGSPCLFFKNQTSSVLPLAVESANVTWLDLAVDSTDLMFVLSFTGSGNNLNDYHLDVYDLDGTRLMRNTGIAVARMTVDPWRNLYSLNREKIVNSPRNEPSVSLWTPSTP